MNHTLKQDLIKVCNTDDLKEGSSVFLKVFPRTAAVFKLKGKYYGMEGSCKHQKASLVKSGKISGRTVTCMRHQWKYDIPTGKCLNNDHGDLKTYKVYIRDNAVFLDRNEILNSPETLF